MREVAWVVFDEIHYMRDKGLNSIFFELFILGREILFASLFIILVLIRELDCATQLQCSLMIMCNPFFIKNTYVAATRSSKHPMRDYFTGLVLRFLTGWFSFLRSGELFRIEWIDNKE